MHSSLRVVALAAMVAACDHSTTFQPGSYGPDGPLIPGAVPLRLTYNPGKDLLPVWLRDGSGIIYTAERWDRVDHDRCLAFMTAGGGPILRYDCPRTTFDDTVNVYEDVAPSVSGRLAFVRVRTNRVTGGPGPDAQELVSSSISDPNSVRVLGSVPLGTPWGTVYEGIAQPAWIGENRLILLGQRIRYPRPCMGCPRDTLRMGIELATLDLDADPPLLTQIPGTDNISSFSLGGTADTVYFTRLGDSRVFRLALSSGLEETVFDFGSAGIARDLTFANGRLVAVVGGIVKDTTDPFLGRIQFDDGGPIYAVTVSTGAVTQVGNPFTLFRRPSLSPDGTRFVVVEWDTTATTTDLFQYSVP
jgi:hypothetical protein